MSENDRSAPVGQWGRPLRKRSRGPRPESADAGAPAVGPVDDGAFRSGDPTIIRADRPAPTGEPVEILGAPKPRVRRERVEPDEVDHQLRDLVALMARGIVDQPDAVRVDILEAGEDAQLELSVDPDDLGHVIGKQGRTARALRLALGAAAAKKDRQASLEIAD